MQPGIVPRFKWRVILPNGTIIDPLPHPHQSNLQVVLPQLGVPGRSTIGPFTLPLFPPGSDDYRKAKWAYDQLVQYARVEAYLIDSDSQGTPGTPCFSGVITTLPKDLNNYSIQGWDSMYLLKLARTEKVSYFPQPSGGTGWTTDLLAKYALKAYTKTFGQDKNTWNLGSYTNDGMWTTTTDDGLAGIVNGTSGDRLLYTGSFTNDKYADCAVAAAFRIVCPASGSAEGSVLAAVADASNFVMGQAQLRWVASNRYEVDAYIFQKSGGTYGAAKSAAKGIITVSQSTIRLEVRLLGYQTSSTVYNWRLLINGIDSNCAWGQVVSAGSPTGGIGVRGSGTINQTYCSQLFFFSKANLFQNGTISAGSREVNQVYSYQPNIDLLNQAATTEGWTYRKNPVAGANQDTVDFQATVGTDLSASIEWKAGEHIVDAFIEPNAEALNTGIVLTASPKGDSDGIITWYDANAIDKYGLILDTVSLFGPSDQLSLRRAADQILNNRINPDQAKRIHVLRTADQLATTSTPTGLRWREGDIVTVHDPRLGWNHQKVTIFAYTLDETSPVMEVMCDQYATHLDASVALDRLVTAVQEVTIRAASPATIAPGGSSSRVTFPINPYKFRVYLGSNSGNMTNNTNAIISYDTVDFDNANGWNAAGFYYIIPAGGGGTWWFSGNVNCNTSGLNRDAFQLTLFILQDAGSFGGTRLHQSQRNTAAGSGTTDSLSVLQTGYDAGTGDYFQCSEGDAIYAKVFFWVLPAAGLPMSGGGTGGQYTYFGGHKISG